METPQYTGFNCNRCGSHFATKDTAQVGLEIVGRVACARVQSILQSLQDGEISTHDCIANISEIVDETSTGIDAMDMFEELAVTGIPPENWEEWMVHAEVPESLREAMRSMGAATMVQDVLTEYPADAHEIARFARLMHLALGSPIFEITAQEILSNEDGRVFKVDTCTDFGEKSSIAVFYSHKAKISESKLRTQWNQDVMEQLADYKWTKAQRRILNHTLAEILPHDATVVVGHPTYMLKFGLENFVRRQVAISSRDFPFSRGKMIIEAKNASVVMIELGTSPDDIIQTILCIMDPTKDRNMLTSIDSRYPSHMMEQLSLLSSNQTMLNAGNRSSGSSIQA